MTVGKIFASLFDEQTGLPNLGRKDNCFCYNCNENKIENGFPFVLSRMIICPTCGNKRCPKATDHNNQCTGSNDPGQPGSRY